MTRPEPTNEREEAAIAALVLEGLGEAFLRRPFTPRPANEERPVRGGRGPQ